MCRATTCKTCGKTTWAGCGQHIAGVKASVPANQWCDGNHPEAAGERKGMFAKILGR